MSTKTDSNFTSLTIGWLLLTLTAAAWFGGVSHLAAPGLTFTALILGGLTLASSPAGPRLPPPGLLITLLLPLLWAVIQLVPLNGLPPAIAAMADPLWPQTAELTGQPVAASISLSPLAGWPTILQGLAYALTLLSGMVLAAKGGNAQRLLRGLAGIGTLICLYGLITYAMGNETVLTLTKTYYLDDLSATFINRNTFATFAGVSVLLNLAIFLERLGEIPSSGRARRRARIQAFLNLVLLPRWPVVLMGFICFTALLLSHSRAGIACTMLGTLVMLTGLYIANRGGRPFVIAMVAAVVFVGMVGLGSLGESFSQRLGQVGTDAELRSTIYHTTLQAVKDHALLGSGLGSFEDIFRIYRTPEFSLNIPQRVDHAHNTWLELALELGIPACLPLLAALVWAIRRLWLGVVHRRRGASYPALGLGIVALAGGHALCDFSLEIPGFTYFIALAVGLALAQSIRVPSTTDPQTKPQPVIPSHSLRPFKPAIIGASLLAATLAGYLTYQNYTLQAPRKVIANLQEGRPVSYETLEQTQKQLLDYTRNPLQPSASQLTLLELTLAARPETNPSRRRVLLLMARTHGKFGVMQTPANPYTWYRIARAESLLNPTEPAAANYLAMSFLTGPWEPNLVWGRLPLAAQVYPQLSPQDQHMVEVSVREAWNTLKGRTWEIVRHEPLLNTLLGESLKDDPTGYGRWLKLNGNRLPTPPAAAPQPASTTPTPSAPATTQ